MTNVETAVVQDVSTTEQRLYAIVLQVASTRRGAIPPDHGELARAALLDLIRRGDLALSTTMHDENAHKPYTISPLFGGRRGSDGALHFGEGDTADFRFTLLREPAFEATLRRYMQDGSLPHLRIGSVEFQVTEAYASGRHPDAGYTTVTRLLERWNVEPETLKREIRLEFRSPTAFNLGEDATTGRRRFRSYPDPRLLFSVLRKRWVSLGGADPGDEMDEWVEKHVEMEPLHLDFQRVMVNRTAVRTFRGEVCYRVFGEARWLPCLHLLADLAFWVSAGYQTTRGLGQVRRLDPE